VLLPLVVVCGVLGLLVGSFLNVVIYRIPRDESIVTPRSHCPRCDTELANRDNIPVISWLVLRGKCRTCANPISARYPFVEALTGGLFAAMAWRFGWDEALPAYLVFTAFLIALSAIDLDTFLLPKKLVWPAFGAGVVLLGGASVLQGDGRSAVEAAIGSAAAFGFLFAIHFISPRGMGFGDVRLASVLGMHLGWLMLGQVAVGLFLAFAISSVVGIGLIATGLRTRKDRVPFGPFLAAGSLLTVFVGASIQRYYVDSIGF
jgi:leader peptidase (prepilin peptidase) / N-methyltransferase